MKVRTKTTLISILVITCLAVLCTAFAKPISASVIGTASTMPEYSFAVVILGIMVLLTVFVAVVRQRITSKTLKIGNTSNQI